MKSSIKFEEMCKKNNLVSKDQGLMDHFKGTNKVKSNVRNKCLS
jgi:hypothetical protein